MVFLSAIILVDYLCPIVPTVLLVGSAVPYALASIVVNVCGLVLLPRSWFINIDNALYSCYQRLVLFIFEQYSGVKLSLYGDILECTHKIESVLLINNHQCTVDWTVANILAIRQGTVGSVRFILKDTLKFLPLYGWCFYQRGCVFVQRGVGFERIAPLRQLQYLKSIHRMHWPFWLVLFPEGTRYSSSRPGVIVESRRFAEQRHLSVLENVLTPRSAGFLLAIEQLRDCFDAVYDITIAYEQTRNEGRHGLAPSMFGSCAKFCSGSTTDKTLHIHMQRIPITNLPVNSDELKLWLHERFVRKDELLRHFYSTPLGSPAFPDLIIDNSPLSLSSTMLPTLVFGISLIPIFINVRWRTYYVTFTAATSFVLIALLKIKKA